MTTPNDLRVSREITKLRTVRPVGPNKHKVQETVELVIASLAEDITLDEFNAGLCDAELVTENNKSAVREALQWKEDKHDIVKPPSESRFSPLLKLNQN